MSNEFGGIYWVSSALIIVAIGLSWSILMLFFTPFQNPNIIFYIKKNSVMSILNYKESMLRVVKMKLVFDKDILYIILKDINILILHVF